MSGNVRADLLSLMEATLRDEQARHDWTYQQIRPLTPPPGWHAGQHVIGDCSKGVQFLCRWVNGPDPMGNGFAGWGNSTTIALHLRHIDHVLQMEVGDVVTFGPSGDAHAAMVLRPGPDPLLWSFGHQGAPNAYRLSQDTRPHQLLLYPIPAYEPTPQDLLRAQTGWFAWVAWRLGEGDWKRYGPTNAKVRPDVPTVISAVWWARLVRFLAGRKKGNKPTTFGILTETI